MARRNSEGGQSKGNYKPEEKEVEKVFVTSDETEKLACQEKKKKPCVLKQSLAFLCLLLLLQAEL